MLHEWDHITNSSGFSNFLAKGRNTLLAALRDYKSRDGAIQMHDLNDPLRTEYNKRYV